MRGLAGLGDGWARWVLMAAMPVAGTLLACSDEHDFIFAATGAVGNPSSGGEDGSGLGGQGGAGDGGSGGTGAGGNAGDGPGTGAQPGTGGGGSGLLPGNTLDCGSAELGPSTVRIEAECAHGSGCGDGVTGGQQGTELEGGGTTVGYIEGGDWLRFDGVALDGITTLTLTYAKEIAGGSVEVRLDDATGTLLGSFAPPTTGGWATWQEGQVSLTAATGTHALYLVATGTSEGILNLDRLVLSGEKATEGASAFHLNQIGFATLGPKHVVVEGPPGLERFQVVDEASRAVWCGDLAGVAFTEWGSSSTHYSVDFTEMTQAGTYRLAVGSSASEPFVVGDAQLFGETSASVVGYFRASRADDAAVWAADGAVPFNGRDGTADVRGGWYDASGDISKYLTHLSYANFLNPQQIPLVAWTLAWTRDERRELAPGATATALEEEALWGADYLRRVLDPAGYFYINVFDGWSGDVGQRQICAFEGSSGARSGEFESALREGGGMSIAALARIASWGLAGDFSAAEYLAGAEAAFAHLDTSGAAYADDGRENVIDDTTGLLAASELFATTTSATYLDAARRRATSLVGRLGSVGYFIADGATRPFWHASDAGLPVVALVRYVEVETDAARREAAQAAIRTHLDYLLRVTGEVQNPYGYARQHTGASAAFFIPQDNESGYWWQGENARLASLAAAAMLGAEATGAAGEDHLALLRFAGRQLDWILGNNPRDLCFLHGFGRENPPEFSGVKPEVGTLTGGIANGYTGTSGELQWMAGAADWEQWRWVEQWLPHAAWYLVAITALER